MLKYYNSKSDYQREYKLPPPYILAFGYFTAAMRNEVPKNYTLRTVMEWAKTRPWSTMYIDYKDFKTQCMEVMKYLDKWFSTDNLVILNENSTGDSENTTDDNT